MLAYLYVKETARRQLPAPLVLAFLALDFRYIDDWPLNVHRAFTYVSVFGTALPFQLMLNDKVTPGRLTDYFMLFEADRDINPLHNRPRYFVFFKAYGTEAELAAIKAKSRPSQESAVLAVFEVLPR